LGRHTRNHEDIEIAIPRGYLAELRARLRAQIAGELHAQIARNLQCSSPGELHAFQLYVVGDGEVRRLADNALPPRRTRTGARRLPIAGEWT
jgi:hypothetical protein